MVLKTVSTLGGGGGGGGGGTPGGANSTIQFNNAGAFGGSANLTWDGGNVQIGSSGRIKLSNGTTNYVAFNAPAVIPANVTWTLPSTDGATGNFLITNGSGTLSWAAANLTPIAPTNYSLPEVSGNTTVGQTLSSTTGGWNGYPAPTYAYQWVRGVSNIGGATSATYPLVDADYNNTIKVIVTATNSAGSANATSNATATIAGTVPGAPTIGTATAGNAQASVAFTAPAVTGGPAITSYTATSSPGGITGSAASSPITVSGLTNGTAYTFTVTATNSIGTGPASAASNSVTPQAIVQDASFAYVPLLLETTSTNGQQNNTFLDSGTANGGVGFPITRNGTPTQGSVTPYWPNGQWSNYFSSSYLTATSSSDYEFGTGNFTVECFVYVISNPAGTNVIVSTYQNSTTGWTIGISPSTGKFYVAVAGDTGQLDDPNALKLNQWVHLALVRSSTTLSFFVNGSRVATASNNTNITTTSICTIGTSVGGGSLYFNGYISNLRVAKGAAVYDPTLTTLTVPTAPLTSTTGGTTPPTGIQTKLLTCQSNRFLDANTVITPKTITVNGTPRVQAFQPFSPTASYTTALYGGSGYFNGSTDYLSVSSNAAFAFGGDFTIEAWVHPTNTSVYKHIFYSAGISALSNGVQFSINTSNQLTFIISFVAVVATSTGTISANTWTHVAVVRSGSAVTLFINGKVDGTGVNATSIASVTTNYIASNNGGDSFAGYIGNLRIVKGTAVYTGAFTPPTLAPLTTAGSTSAASYSSTTNVNTSFAAANTSLLLNMTNAGIYDAAAQNNVITVADAQVSTTQSKWLPTSVRFDGTGDWLTAIDNPQLQLGTGDFTIDGWVYLSANGIVYGLVSKGTATTGWSVNVTVLNKLQFSYTTSNLTGTTSLATGTWYYFAVVRSGSATGNLNLYLNASLEATSGGAVTDNFNQTSILYVGADRIGTSALNGYLQDVRITKAARAITLPTASFPVQ
jgi:hypothetical protein